MSSTDVAPARGPRTTPRQVFTRGIWRENAVVVQMLGLCPALAVTNTVANSLAMAGATFFVLMGSSLFISLLRNMIPNQVRISTFILIIATFVTVADMILEATIPGIHRALGPFVALIVCNCMILGRQEAFASRNTVARSLIDAAGTGLGFGIIMLIMGTVREILGSGTVLGVSVLGQNFEPWVIMILPPGGFLTLGVLLLIVNWWNQRDEQQGVKPDQWPEGIALPVLTGEERTVR